jgi:hypothetical protein
VELFDLVVKPEVIDKIFDDLAEALRVTGTPLMLVATPGHVRKPQSQIGRWPK